MWIQGLLLMPSLTEGWMLMVNRSMKMTMLMARLPEDLRFDEVTASLKIESKREEGNPC
jgi:hypothetical protein